MKALVNDKLLFTRLPIEDTGVTLLEGSRSINYGEPEAKS